MKFKKWLILVTILSIFDTTNYYLDIYKEMYKTEVGQNIIIFSRRQFNEKDKEFLARLKDSGIENIAINQLFYQDSINSNDIVEAIVPEEYINDLIKEAKNKKINLLFRWAISSRDGKPRTEINPQNFARWFENYKKIAMEMAEFSEKNEIPYYSLGCEIDHIVSRHKENFIELTKEIKKIYSGKIGYCWNVVSTSNLEEILSLEEILETDLIFLDCYLPLTNPKKAKWQWLYYLDEINGIASKTKKKVLITEIGYRSVERSNERPWDWHYKGNFDEEIQQMCFETFFQALREYPTIYDRVNHVEMAFIWGSGYGDLTKIEEDSLGYTPWGKKAEKTIIDHAKSCHIFKKN